MKTKNVISRRSVLNGAVSSVGAGLVGYLLSSTVVVAQEHEAEVPNALMGVYKKKLGDFELTFIADGTFDLPSEIFATNAAEGQVEQVLKNNGLPTGTHTTPLVNLLVQTEEKTILFDTGLGDVDAFGPNVGKLLPTLLHLGIMPTDITDVVISHFHPDHVGAVSFDGKLNFPNAQFYFPQVEWDFLNGPAIGDEQVDGLIALAKAKLEPAVSQGQVIFYKGDTEIISGVQTIATPGHTPGHHSFLLNSENKSLLLTVDALNHPVLTMENPEWIFGFDALPDETVATRHQLFGRAADENLQIFSNHFPFPGVGYVVRERTGFRFVTAS